MEAKVGEFSSGCVAVESTTSIRRALSILDENDLESAAAIEERKFLGVIEARSLLLALASDADPAAEIRTLITSAPSLLNIQTLSEALRSIESHGVNRLHVIDSSGALVGALSATTIAGGSAVQDRPAMVGGMATPFGVYLTSGVSRGGKKGWHLLLTGAFLFSFFLIGRLLELWAGQALPKSSPVHGVLPIFPIALMVVVFRLLPIAGYHAAEHQVVHAIERKEPLVPDVVSRMPRVHPRCGTNVAVALTLFLAIQMSGWAADPELRTLVAALVTLLVWRPLGAFVQHWITTRPARPHQIESAISAANELLTNHALAPARTLSPIGRLVNSGMLHVMTGSFLAYALAALVAAAFGVPLGQF